ncbi:Hypothetical_protein [Hexamita inflata]|uniref:Hypothetical_protein n=1 Tax=Hexamita inflata TaxID=28002 RepID=A0AA86QQD9_9EUKA|nr:Hypothetical protein HINF_LOCUS50315 [Hexamita inflata]
MMYYITYKQYIYHSAILLEDLFQVLAVIDQISIAPLQKQVCGVFIYFLFLKNIIIYITLQYKTINYRPNLIVITQYHAENGQSTLESWTMVDFNLSKLEISITQTRQCFQKLVIPPSVEKCINTELSLRRGNQDEEYIENKFTTYRDVQAVEVGDHTGARVPIVKKEQHGNKESIFAPGAGLLQHNDNPDLDPVAYKEQLKAKQHDLYYDHFNDYDFGDIPYSHWNEDNDNQNYQQPNNNNDNQEPAQNNYQEQNVNYQQPEPEPNKQFIAQDLFPNVFKNINSQNDNQTGKENIMDTRTGTEQNIPREVQKAQSQFKELILKAINDHFQNEGRNDLKTDSLRQALINYRQYYAEVKRIHLDFRKIAAQLGLTEKQVSQMFRTLQDNELDDWSPEKIQAVRERAEQLRLTHPELSKEQLKEQLDKEFSLTPEYSQSPKKITNRISYILKKLFG